MTDRVDVMNTWVKITEQTQQLPEHIQKEVLDFVEFLQQKYAIPTTQPQLQSPRPAGLHAGLVFVAEDFDAPLDDAFWLGQS